jgi:hypothetical protein
VKRLTTLFTELGFRVKVYDDLTTNETKSKLLKYQKSDMSGAEMFGMAILSHGEDHGRLFNYDSDLFLNDYINPIKTNPTLVGKPKVKIYILL